MNGKGKLEINELLRAYIESKSSPEFGSYSLPSKEDHNPYYDKAVKKQQSKQLINTTVMTIGSLANNISF